MLGNTFHTWGPRWPSEMARFSGVDVMGPFQGLNVTTGDSVMVITAPFTFLHYLYLDKNLCQAMFFGDEKGGCVFHIHESPVNSMLARFGWCQTVRNNKNVAETWPEPLRDVQMSQVLNFPNSSILPPFLKDGNPHIFIRFLGYLLKQIEVCMQPDCRCLPSDIPSMKLHWTLSLHQKQWRPGKHGPVRPKSAKEETQRRQRRASSFGTRNGMSQTTELAVFSFWAQFSHNSSSFLETLWALCQWNLTKPALEEAMYHNVPTCLVHEDVGDAKLTDARISLHLTDVSSKFMRFPSLNLHKSTLQNHEGMVASPKTMVSDVSGSFIGSLKPSQVWSQFFQFFCQVKLTCQQNEQNDNGKKTTMNENCIYLSPNTNGWFSS